MGLSMDGPAAYLQCVRQPESRAGVHSLITGCWSYETVIVSIRAQSWIPGADMARCIIPYAVAVLIGFPAPLHAQVEHSALVIDVAEGTTAEEQTRQQLQRITTELDLSRWLFTRRVRIEAMAIPHSHPVLTVNTRYLGNDTAQIATFVHEQIHWFLSRNDSATESAIADLRRLYPDAPGAPPQGARDLHSTYLHLLVCALEYDAVRDLFGQDVAQRTLRGWRHYSWVYAEVLDRPEPIWDVLRRHGIDSPDARP